MQEHLERARAARTDGDHASAVIEYRNVLQHDPNHSVAHYELALSLLAAGEGGDAVWEFRESFRLDPTNLDARLRLAWLALAGGRPDEALEQSEAILDRDPDHLEGKLLRVAGLLAKEEFDRAGTEAEMIVARWPEEKRAHYNLARARAGQGRLAEAERSLLRFRNLDGGSLAATQEVLRFYGATHQHAKSESFLREAFPGAAPEDRADLALALADLLEKDERLVESEEFLAVALAAAPQRIDVRERLATLLAGDGRLDEALGLLEEAQASRQSDPEVPRIRGDLLMRARRFDDALVAFRDGLRLDPDSGPLLLREAEALLRLGDLEASGARIEALLEKHPEDPLAALMRVRTLALASRTDEAIALLRGLVARDPELAPAHFLLGVLQLAMNRPEQALGSLEIAASRMTGPTAREAGRLLAEAQLRVGEFGAAVTSAEKALVEDPQDLRARIVLAEALQGSGSTERAKSILLDATRESPALHAALARLFVRSGRLEDAQREVERALALEPDSVQWVVDLVWVLLEQGKARDALEIVRARMLERPEVPDYPNLLGQIALRQEQQAAAERAFRKAIEVDPAFVPGYVNVARLAVRSQRYAEAVELLQGALAQRPGDAEALRELGIVEYRRGNPEAAIVAFQEALRADPTSDVTRANLAQVRADLGRDLPQALDIARSIRQSDPTNPVYAETLGLALYHAGLHAAAAEQFRAAIDLAPHPIAVYHYRLGLALIGNGDRVGAARELEQALAIDRSFADAEDARGRLEALRRPPSSFPPSS